jgi:hypothetical protein
MTDEHELEHGPTTARKRCKACRCGARFRTPQELRRHVRKATAGEPVLWTDAIHAAKLRREASS